MHLFNPVISILTVMVVQVSQADRCNEDRPRPTKGHRHELHKHHEKCINKEDISPDDEVHDVFVDKAGIGVK